MMRRSRLARVGSGGEPRVVEPLAEEEVDEEQADAAVESRGRATGARRSWSSC